MSTVTSHLSPVANAASEPSEQWSELVEAFRDPEVRFVVPNPPTTDLEYVPEAFACGVCPDTFPGYVAALLYERYVAVHGNPKKGLVFVSRELLCRGEHLRKTVLEHAQNWALPGAFAQWVVEANWFLNTLDAVVPAFPLTSADKAAAVLDEQSDPVAASDFFHLSVYRATPRDGRARAAS